MTCIKYLEYVIDYVGIHVDPKKVHILKDWTIPQNIHELRFFLGLVNFYQWFILGFSHIAWPLNQLTKGNGKNVFKSTLTQQQDFEQIKKIFVLHLYLCYLICIIPLRLRWMHQTMPSTEWSLSHVTQPCFILKPSTTLLEGIRSMKKNYMPLWKLLNNGDTTFLERKRSSSLTINICSSLHPSRNYRQPDNSNRLITCNNFNGN